jgi:hypothetical protein
VLSHPLPPHLLLHILVDRKARITFLTPQLIQSRLLPKRNLSSTSFHFDPPVAILEPISITRISDYCGISRRCYGNPNRSSGRDSHPFIAIVFLDNVATWQSFFSDYPYWSFILRYCYSFRFVVFAEILPGYCFEVFADVIR